MRYKNNLDALAEKVKKQAQERALQRGLALVNNNLVNNLVNNDPQIKKIMADRAVQAGRRRARLAESKIIEMPKQTKILREYEPCIREPYVEPKIFEIATPYNKNPELDVSIIVPLFRSSEVVVEQIRSWDLNDDGLKKEIIYVSDACPDNSINVAAATWVKNETCNARFIALSSNSGFSTACNAGAKLAFGKFLIFLNADTTVTPNWIKPILSPLESDDNIGIVGNMQLKYDNTIDSAGSEWLWDNKSFEHIGRSVYHGKRLTEMMTLAKAPEDLLQPGERDMVTGCCFAIRKNLFEEVGGFDIGYRIGYWEDADLNMKVKSLGYKVYFQPHSIIYHKSSHSRAGIHPFIMDNAKLFYDKWIDTNKIDSLVKAKRP